MVLLLGARPGAVSATSPISVFASWTISDPIFSRVEPTRP
jgi:hypothetical protein